MTLYYVKQFNLYYAGTSKDGTFNFTNTRSGAVANNSRKAAEDLCTKLGDTACEIEERVL